LIFRRIARLTRSAPTSRLSEPKDQKRFVDKEDGLYFDGKKCAED
jgi:hypothetical protein